MRQQELQTCKKIGYEFYCEDFFMVKHKSKYSCASAIYFNLGPDIIKDNCILAYYFNKTNITPTALDGGNKIILANWPDDKHIICNVNNDIPVKIPSHPYVLVNRSVLCNCGIEAENNFLVESLAACHDTDPKLVMYFMVNSFCWLPWLSWQFNRFIKGSHSTEQNYLWTDFTYFFTSSWIWF